ncbi:MAG: dihydroorotase [SAR86 cluster bacterium]|uniref:Dihydroorotase n=1 Tax=SAR86 cluster bacterium TaxID=2030880 RepID=A0A2A4MPA7_9GAMM|nr:MAG: dihydroorotase [SAR86 cluster bacterium]
MKQNSITLATPDDWHLHLRDGKALANTVAHSARSFRRAMVMPNLSEPITDVDKALAYRQRICASLSSEQNFDPLMTVYLTDSISLDEIRRIKDCEFIHAIKYYPSGATTNSDSGVTHIDKVMPVLELMAELGIPLLIHGELTDNSVDIFDREALFIEQVLSPLVARLPHLKIVLEYITTSHAVDFVTNQGSQIAATITVHHLLYNRNHMLVGGIRPHLYCLPILKRNSHQQALLKAATSGNSKFFLGTDSAPHAKTAKENACGCAGTFSAPGAIELYAEVFDSLNALDKLEDFASHFGPDFYNLPRNTDQIQLQRQAWNMPNQYQLGDDVVIPIRANEAIQWRIIEATL